MRCRDYRGCWHRSYPPLSYRAIYTLSQPCSKARHLEFPRHTFVHCGDFVPAAPLRARTLVSVSFPRHHLSMPLRILGLVVRYTANCLIRRRPILWRISSISLTLLGNKSFQRLFPMWYYPQFPEVIPLHRASYLRVTGPSATSEKSLVNLHG